MSTIDIPAFLATVAAPIRKLWVLYSCVSKPCWWRMSLSAEANIFLLSVALSGKENNGPGCFPLIARYDMITLTEHTF